MADKFSSPPPAYPPPAHTGNYPPQGASQDYYGGQQPQYPPPQQGYYPPPQQGYPQQGMYYGPPQQGYPPPQGQYVEDRRKDMGTGICAGILGALACCCCLDIIF
ncbi:hypothetical protein D8B26_002913 [Coccidioides posadasii str. Silveira]|uniref:Uncharacterized protein n=3 Tax=Coccidioides posadasii TaxID=199306 RepID=E9CXU1_COCPS|nr:UV-induced protein uvi15, putative [Coccidioides posadasii C735 delta SOWgp]EER26686.1 UV-induced protein uvi15, putative [Coccidioides posadasii C735 delta SOWgp]EFW20768.1 hypothetical protein CPSG_02611 [Coccidioides posadasii str. Silveira]KMM72676.1 hypothetical protein CPAG_08970 [Coccidioides posadasii RMSCC 3488]QVM08219.1 hypothetical protein D8B26_002913 [Coccidioides posadasii str. Silveira]|eukprot:XP_003068831.1 UV-induced protein uvi15, putative [Coccidioides posadasii C735 delta SOWgp]